MIDSVKPLSSEALLQVLSLSEDATAIYTSEDLRIQFANDGMIAIWGKDRSVIGKTFEEAIPEIKGQPFTALLQNVWRTGETYTAKDTPANLVVNGKLQTSYFDFTYRAILDEQGQTYCLLHTAKDVTESLKHRIAIAENTKREQHMNEELAAMVEELAAANEEMAATNEELSATNDELIDTRDTLRRSLDAVKESEARFQNLVREATTGIIVLNGDNADILIVNNAYARLIGRRVEDLLHQSLFSIIPEAEPAFRPLIDGVRTSGEPVYLYEHPYFVYADGEKIEGYLNLVYQPYREYGEEVTGVMVLCQDVTSQVDGKLRLAQAEERARLATAAAKLGTYDFNFKTQEVITSPRFDEIMGFNAPQKHEAYLGVVHPDDLDLRARAYQKAFKTGHLHYTARIIHGDEIRWIHAEGTIYYDSQHQPERMLGTMQDVTGQQLQQQQKDDFISIASHELKTPVTSLKAALQLIDKLKDNPNNAMLPKLIMQARKSVERVGILIEDLLNVGRLQQGEMHLQKSEFIVSQLLNACCNPISIAGKYKIQIQGDLELQVEADEHRIDQVVTNLLNNAVKYAPDSELITVVISRENGFAKVAVTDYGPGIPEAKLAHLFDRYYRAEPSGHHVSGLGLGLYISSEIIHRHGGELSVTSEVGKGSTFYFTLPL
ncbi:PAS domain-containing protein [Mucilaginibacter sp. Bleaf8]|uniref:ATP-binding protein n=1 Tax=Mucilaginibacter sp. Bleaf8 TaxID=2834430 RepID=UPI001BCB9672|nr:ATP-binding protein [Mucilaginibacter sp. Bleaf8]MBS7563949.1 PAS domain-containing protein [Mucilaginibacter sp. Bleaf8]